ncbi:MAG: superinfection immunity protein [Actinomycetota bacterium]|nr:superinfection immunity protein [Actinomycetota bacterium]
MAYPQVTYVSGGQILTDQRPHNTEAVIAWILTVLTLFYFLPWAIAATRGKSNSVMIGLLNFLLGWTFVGWIVALVMACMSHQILAAAPAMVIHQPSYPPGQPGLAPPKAGFVPPPPLGPSPDWSTRPMSPTDQRTAAWDSPPSSDTGGWR